MDAATLKARFPEFTQADSIVDALIEEAERITGASGNDELILWAAAHLLALEAEHTGAPDGGAGVVTAESIGPLSKTYATQVGGGAGGASNEDAAYWATSSYGRRFLTLQARTPAAVLTTIVT
ncbi:MAG: DUF4054 domain-containing protein [Rhodococcus sp.]|nr:DUF4054 domain-containing protein [Rhodococcus sp. (in: high G+C Gram-positive bacteria)]